MRKLDDSSAELERIATLPPAERRPRYEKLATAYQALLAAQRNIDSHVQYNRLWQGEIMRHKALYDAHTRTCTTPSSNGKRFSTHWMRRTTRPSATQSRAYPPLIARIARGRAPRSSPRYAPARRRWRAKFTP
jgi:hypothetical protein